MEEQQKNRDSDIYVWWDVQSCVIPSGYDALRISRAIKSAMNNLGFWGSLQVDGFSEKGLISKDLIDRFVATGMELISVDLALERSNQYRIYSSINRWKMLKYPRGSVVVVISDIERGYGPILRSLKEAGFVTFSFSSSDWCNVLALGPRLDPRQYGFAS